ncbi:MAG: CIA30 family protein [Actinomycetota bacterium]
MAVNRQWLVRRLSCSFASTTWHSLRWLDQAGGVVTRAVWLLVLVGSLFAACGAGDAADSAVTVASGAAPSVTTPAPAATIPSTTTAESSTTTSAPQESAGTVPSTTSSPVDATTGTTPVDCQRLEEFDGPGGWFIVNDGVMGGRSNGRAVIEDSTLRFSGTVVTAGGGFTSIRLGLDSADLAGTDSIRVRLRPDARTYGVTLEDDQTINGRRISHGADLPGPVEVGNDGFAIVEVPHSVLEPTVFGQLVLAEPFRPDAASEIGIIIADGVDGEFALEVDWIAVCG